VSKQVAAVKFQSAQIASLSDTVSKQGVTLKTQSLQISRLNDTVAKQVIINHLKTQAIEFANLMKTVSRQGAKLIQLENRIISLTAQENVSSENQHAPGYLRSPNTRANGNK